MPFPKKLQSSALVAAMATALVTAAGTGGADSPDALARARQQFEAARTGSAAAAESARAAFAGLLRADPDHPLYLAYYGSTLLIQARESAAPWTRVRLANEGVGMLDRAVGRLDGRARAASWPIEVELEARLVSMASFIALPRPFFRRIDDAKRQLQAALGDPRFVQASSDLQGHIQYEGALIAREEHDTAGERAALQRVLALRPPSVNLTEVRQRLGELN